MLLPVLQVPNDAAGYYLLGKICRLTNRHKVAVSYQKAALTVDPLLWCAYEELCMLGDSLASTVYCWLSCTGSIGGCLTALLTCLTVLATQLPGCRLLKATGFKASCGPAVPKGVRHHTGCESSCFQHFVYSSSFTK